MNRHMACSASFEDDFSVLGVLRVAGIHGCSRKYKRGDKRANLYSAFHCELPF
jgi:hypothetical protein